jgi:hypothetical protein
MDITIHLEDEQIRKLEYIQQQTNQDAATILNRTLVAALDQQYAQLQHHRETPSEIFQELGLIGCFTGDPNLSTNYKAVILDYLDEKSRQGRL